VAIIAGRRSKWVIVSLVCAVISFGSLFWLVPMISHVARTGGPLADLERWTTGNWLRVAVEAVGFGSALLALDTETQSQLR
jgi:hypothetical protein